MAWHSLYLWYAPWSKRELFMEDMIYWYREYVLKTDEQRKEEKRIRDIQGKQAVASLAVMGAMCSSFESGFSNEFPKRMKDMMR